MTSLEEFAEGKERKKGRASFWSTLPEDVRQQIIDSDAPSEVCVEWLKSLGFDRSSFGTIDPQRRRARREREADAG